MKHLLSLLAAVALSAQTSGDVPANRISADSLRGHVSFLASDLLEGRDTPSRGLDLAAEYIAAQFRRAGLKPAGDDGYFQTSAWLLVEPAAGGFEMTVEGDGKTFHIGAGQVRLENRGPVQIEKADLIKLKPGDAVKPGEARGKVIVLPLARSDVRAYFGMREALRAAQPALVLLVTADAVRGGPAALLRDAAAPPEPASIWVRDADLFQFLAGNPAFSVSVRAPPPLEKRVKLRNVIGVLPGADPALKDTYVLVTAHYDHVGVRPGEGDRIFNGANDDASGTASVIELAAALARAKEPPKRSIVFMTFFGEEKGLLGSRYYGRHPVLPIARTVAEINLEQLGRTDAPEGPQLSTIAFTGQDFSDVPRIFSRAGSETGVKVERSPNSDRYFAQSDNQALADLGVPAHTICVAFSYPDYHQPGDEWPKLDYENMAKVDRAIALGVLMLADSSQAPAWNESNPAAAKYLEAWKKLHQ